MNTEELKTNLAKLQKRYKALEDEMKNSAEINTMIGSHSTAHSYRSQSILFARVASDIGRVLAGEIPPDDLSSWEPNH